MKRIIRICLLLAVLLSGSQFSSQGAGAAKQSARSYDPGQARYRPGEILVRLNPGSGMELSAAAVPGGRRIREFQNGELELWQVPIGEEEKIVSQLSANPQVVFAEPNYLVHAFAVPDDPGYSNQWGLAQVNASAAWDISTGSAEVIVAVIDSGIDLNHPDLVAKLVPGYDFIDNDLTPNDRNGHGTLVAGIIAARTNNGVGIAGMSWGARLMPLKVLGSNGEGVISNIIEAIDWAVDHGAKIINMSFGNYQHSQSLKETIARAHSAGVLLVAAAGNDGIHAPAYPASYPYVLGVGATNRSGKRAAYSNVSVNVDVMAPGGEGTGCTDPNGIYSTFPTYTVSLSSSGCPKDYASLHGTSLAAPMVSGLAVLVWSMSPEFGPDLVSRVITSTTDYIGGPFLHGYGLVDAKAALEAVSSAEGAPVLLPIDNRDGDGNYLVEWMEAPGAVSYLLQESSSPSFTSPKDVYSGPAKQYSISGKEAGMWYYRVRAILSGGASTWSQVQSSGVIPGIPELEVVRYETGEGDRYVLAWTSVTGASGFTVEESLNPDFDNAHIKYKGPETSYLVTGQSGGTWYYRVHAYNDAGRGSWSSSVSAYVEQAPLAAPRLKAIENGDHDGNFNLYWNDVAEDAVYLVEWSRDPYFSHPEPPLMVSISQLSVVNWPAGVWYVRVRAISASGNSPWSSPVSTMVVTRTSLPLLMSGHP